MRKMNLAKKNHSYLIHKTFVYGLIALILSMGVLYAKEMSELEFLGTARVHPFDNTSTRLFVEPVFQSGGVVAQLNNMMPSVSRMPTHEWNGENVTLYLQKPQTLSPDPVTQWNCNFTFTNPTTYSFFDGQVEITEISGNWNINNVTPTIISTSVDKFTNFDVNVAFNTAVSITTTDHVKIQFSFMMLGNRRYLDIDIYFVPFDYNVTPIPRITYNPTGPAWTNQNVVATIDFNKSGVSITNNGGNTQYIFTDNGIFTFNYRDTAGVTGTATATVSWINRTPPNTFTPTITNIGARQITINGSTTSPVSGVAITGYFYSTNGGATWYGPFTQTSHTVLNLTPDSPYTVMMRAVDSSGNTRASSSIMIRTAEIDTSFYLPINVTTNETGYISTFQNLAGGTWIPFRGDHYEGDTIYVLASKIGAPNGNNNFGMQFSFVNNTAFNWTGGTITQTLPSNFNAPNGGNPATSVSSTVNAGGTGTVYLGFRTNLGGTGTTTDFLPATITYMVDGAPKTLTINFIFMATTHYGTVFAANGGLGTKAVVWGPTNAALNLGANTFERSGHTFLGWGTSPDGPVVYNNNESILANTYTAGSKVVLYAIWD
jgi:hypothetical protein